MGGVHAGRAAGQAPRSGQLYVYDPQEACEKRQAWDSGLQEPVLLSLHNMLLRLDGTGVANPSAHWNKHMHQKMQE